jgi:hypothetical protein
MKALTAPFHPFLAPGDRELLEVNGAAVQSRIDQLKHDGRIGGGPCCPNPACHARALDPLPNDNRFQCRVCKCGATVRITPDGVEVRMVSIKRKAAPHA